MAERKIVQNAVFRGKQHDNKILKVQILLSRNFVVIAQAPIVSQGAKTSPICRAQRPPQSDKDAGFDNWAFPVWRLRSDA